MRRDAAGREGIREFEFAGPRIGILDDFVDEGGGAVRFIRLAGQLDRGR